MNDFLKKLNILYMDNDYSSRKNIYTKFDSYLNNIYFSVNEKESTDIYHNLLSQKIRLDAIICELKEQSFQTVINLLKKIRIINEDIPILLLVEDLPKEQLFEIIQFDVSGYFTKPVNTQKVLNKLNDVCHKYHQNETIKKQKQELEQYLKAVDNVAIVTKTDLKGKITFINELFVETSKYHADELLGKSQNIIRHPSTPKEIFTDMWSTIKQGKVWNGNIKNLAKDGSEYFVNATIFPIYDDLGENIIEYIAIRFLTTKEELIKREFRKKVMTNIQDFKKKELEYLSLIKTMHQQINYFKQNDTTALQKKNEELEINNKKLRSQLAHFEKEIKTIRDSNYSTVNLANQKIKKLTEEFKNIQIKYSSSEKALKKFYEELNNKKEKIVDLETRLTEKNKQIENLFEVIEQKDKDLKKLLETS